MAQPLPGIVVDTGELRTITHSGKASLRLDAAPGQYAGFATTAEPFLLHDESELFSCLVGGDPGDPGGAGFYKLTLTGPGIITPVVLEFEVIPCRHGPWSRMSNEYDFALIASNFRLGVWQEDIVTDPIPVPDFWTNRRQIYGWYADENTTLEVTFAGHTTGVLYFQPGGGSAAWGPTQHVGMTPEAFDLPGFAWIYGSSPGSNEPSAIHAIFSSLHADGAAIDTTDLNDGIMVGAGGVVNCYHPGFLTEDTEGARAPYRFTYDLDISKFGDGTTHAKVIDSFVVPKQYFPPGFPTGALKDPQADFLTMPFLPTVYLIHNVTWPTHKKNLEGPLFFDLLPDWAGHEDPPIPDSDWKVPIYASPARFDPGGIAPYAPVTISFGAISVHRPNGLTPSVWVSSDTGSLTVIEAPTTTTLRVATEGAFARRTLLHYWRNWTTPGDPLFVPDRYEITKHDYFAPGSDVFGWQHHAWLRCKIDAPADQTLTLRVEGVYLDVFDAHTTEPNRTDSFGKAEDSFVFTYTIPLVSGANDFYLDLLFPAEGGPAYYGRVDAMQISGMAVGDTVIRDLALTPRENLYFKIDFGAPVQRGDYDAIVFAADGSFGLGNWPDQAYKTEKGRSGGGVRYVEPLTNFDTGEILDFVRVLSVFLGNLNKMEGWTATYDGTVYAAAMIDPFLHALPDNAESVWNIVPYARFAPGSPYKPDCSPRVRQLAIVTGQSFMVRVRWDLQAGIEQIVVKDNARAPDGTQAQVTRVDNGHVYTALSTGGYAVISPVPGEADYQSSE